MKSTLRWIAVLPGGILAVIVGHYLFNIVFQDLFISNLSSQFFKTIDIYCYVIMNSALEPIWFLVTALYIVPQYKRIIGIILTTGLILFGLAYYIFNPANQLLDYLNFGSYFVSCAILLAGVYKSYPGKASTDGDNVVKMMLYYNPVWMHNLTLAQLFMCEIPAKFQPKEMRDLEPYQEVRLATLIEEAFKQNNPVIQDVEYKLDLQVISTTPLGIAKEIMQGDNWATYFASAQFGPIGQEFELLDKADQQYYFKTTCFYELMDQLLISL